jgi:pimeloyl-ACP methyl ester carboxylesterase
MHVWLVGALALALAPAPPVAPRLEGEWSGVLQVGGSRLRLVLHVVTRPQGGFAASLDSLDQGARGLPIDEVSLRDRTLSLRMKALGASYTGTVADDGNTIAGEWIQGGAYPLSFRRGAPDAPRRPQEPKRSPPYREEEVVFENGGVTLAGTLTLPRDQGPFPAVVLISGSGPQDRNETIAGHQPFLVLADHLTRQGLAVLRYDDRGVGKSTGSLEAATTLDFAEDVRAALALLRKRPDVDPRRLGLVGHSEGALVAPLAANREADVAFVVLLAGTGVPGEQVLQEQVSQLTKASGLGPEIAAQQKGVQQALFAILRQENDPAVARRKLADVIRPALAQVPEGQRAAAVEAQVRNALSPWLRHFISYDPMPALRALKCPALALYGEKDLLVPPSLNAGPVEEALKAAGRAESSVRVLPGLNHMFQTGGSGLPSEYGTIEETMSPAALHAISEWIRERIKTAG